MTADDLALILRFLYGDERGLGVAQAAQDIGTKPERLREMLKGTRPVPFQWEMYLRERVSLRGDLDGWRDATRSMVQGLSPETRRQIVFDGRL